MKIFLYKIGLYFIIILSVFSTLKFVFNTQKKNYNSAFVDKLKILQSNSKEKKIILIGGSAVGWGISAELIEKQTGIKTINLGHNAGFGLLDFEPFLLQNINKDDIIIFSPEWIFYTNPQFFDNATLDNLIRYNFEYGNLLNNNLYKIKSFFTKIHITVSDHEDLNTPYRYKCYNKNGDIISQCGLNPGKILNYTIDHDLSQIDFLNKYFPFLISNKTIFLFPPTQSRVYQKNFEFLHKIESSLIEKKYILADRLEDNVYPDSLFFDKEYHVTCGVKLVRTNKLINFIKQNILLLASR